MGLRLTKLHRLNSCPDFFLYTCRYCADFWHISQPPAFLKAIPVHTMTGTRFLYLKGGYLDFSHLAKLKNICINEIYVKEQHKSSITIRIKNVVIFHNVCIRRFD